MPAEVKSKWSAITDTTKSLFGGLKSKIFGSTDAKPNDGWQPPNANGGMMDGSVAPIQQPSSKPGFFQSFDQMMASELSDGGPTQPQPIAVTALPPSQHPAFHAMPPAAAPPSYAAFSGGLGGADPLSTEGLVAAAPPTFGGMPPPASSMLASPYSAPSVVPATASVPLSSSAPAMRFPTPTIRTAQHVFPNARLPGSDPTKPSPSLTPTPPPPLITPNASPTPPPPSSGMFMPSGMAVPPQSSVSGGVVTSFAAPSSRYVLTPSLATYSSAAPLQQPSATPPPSIMPAAAASSSLPPALTFPAVVTTPPPAVQPASHSPMNRFPAAATTTAVSAVAMSSNTLGIPPAMPLGRSISVPTPAPTTAPAMTAFHNTAVASNHLTPFGGSPNTTPNTAYSLTPTHHNMLQPPAANPAFVVQSSVGSSTSVLSMSSPGLAMPALVAQSSDPTAQFNKPPPPPVSSYWAARAAASAPPPSPQAATNAAAASASASATAAATATAPAGTTAAASTNRPAVDYSDLDYSSMDFNYSTPAIQRALKKQSKA